MKTKAIHLKSMVAVGCASLALLAFGVVTVDAADKTLAGNEAVWGKPLAIQQLENGTEKRFYKCQNSMDLGYFYFTYKDGTVIAEGLAVAVPEGKRSEEKELRTLEWSKSFSRDHAVSAEDLDKSWGKPVAVSVLKDGSEERYYKTGNTMEPGNPFFLLKDGKVVGYGLAGKDALTAIASAAKKTGAKGLPVIDWNTDYYQRHPATAAELDKVWGKPAAVKPLKDGSEERYYHSGNMMGADTPFFLVKDGKVISSGLAGAGDIKS